MSDITENHKVRLKYSTVDCRYNSDLISSFLVVVLILAISAISYAQDPT
jgi:hypothetical protein